MNFASLVRGGSIQPHWMQDGSSFWYAESVKGAVATPIPLSHTTRIIEEFARAGRPYDLILLPGQGHGFTGSSEAYELDAVRRYFVEHLKP
ncbi:MAG: alpha/beta hydrolase family protein [Gemmatimonadota bacterium]